jgi:cobalamin biosynthesis Mg chelatase CobN
VNVTGIMAQFGRGLIQDVSNQMLQKFTVAMRAELEKPVETAAATPVETATAAATATKGAASGAATVASAASGVSTGTGIGAAGSTAAAPGAAPSVSGAENAGAGVPAVARAPVAAAPPIEVLSFGGGLLLRAAGRTMRRPVFWIVLATMAGLVYWFRR